MSGDPGAARAALVLAAALGVGALAPEPEAAPCVAPAAAGGEEIRCGGGGPLPDPARLVLGLPIDPNRADPESLEALPGIGPAIAAAWVRTRQEAPFCAADDLDRVPGIGPKRVRGLGSWLAFDPTSACGRDREPPFGPRR